jgi:hypothetical protein
MNNGIVIGESLQRKIYFGARIDKDFSIGAYVAQKNKLNKEAEVQYKLDKTKEIKAKIREIKGSLKSLLKKEKGKKLSSSVEDTKKRYLTDKAELEKELLKLG